MITLTAVAYTVLLERKVVGRMQNRWGPSRVGPFGLLQPLADGIKLFLKEDLMPLAVERPLFLAGADHCAGVRAGVDCGGAVRRIRRRYKGVDIFEIADVNIGLLVILGITSIGVYGIALSGWSSNNKYSLLGSLRATAQLISYELALGLSLVGVVLRAGSLRLRDIVDVQSAHGIAVVEHLWRLSVCRVLHLSDGGVCGDQPRALRSAGGGDGTDGRVSHRIQFDEVRHVLHGGVRQHDHGQLRGDAAVFRRMRPARSGI